MRAVHLVRLPEPQHRADDSIAGLQTSRIRRSNRLPGHFDAERIDLPARLRTIMDGQTQFLSNRGGHRLDVGDFKILRQQQIFQFSTLDAIRMAGDQFTHEFAQQSFTDDGFITRTHGTTRTTAATLHHNIDPCGGGGFAHDAAQGCRTCDFLFFGQRQHIGLNDVPVFVRGHGLQQIDQRGPDAGIRGPTGMLAGSINHGEQVHRPAIIEAFRGRHHFRGDEGHDIGGGGDGAGSSHGKYSKGLHLLFSGAGY